MSDVEAELVLRDLYYSPKLGYRSTEHLYNLAQKEDSSITRNFVKNWLQQQKVYTKHKRYNNPAKFRKTFVRDLGEQVQVDLVILQKYSQDNNGYQYILMAIELLSRFAFAIPLKKRDGESTRDAMQLFLDDYHDKYHDYPKLMQFDEGKEFLNKDVIALLKKHDIEYFTTASKRKASIVERLNRTIQTKLRKIFEKQSDSGRPYEWVSHLSDVIENYNTQVNRSIGIAPIDVHEQNKYTIWGRLYGNVLRIDKPKFNVGDTVRVLKFSEKYRGAKFQKYYREKYPKKISKKTGKPINEHPIEAKDKPPFSDEVFTIYQVLLGDPVVYRIYSPEAELNILGVFYESELSLVL